MSLISNLSSSINVMRIDMRSYAFISPDFYSRFAPCSAVRAEEFLKKRPVLFLTPVFIFYFSPSAIMTLHQYSTQHNQEILLRLARPSGSTK